MPYDGDPANERMLQRFAVASEIVEFLVQLRSVIEPNEWLSGDTFDANGMEMELCSDDGEDVVSIDFRDNYVALSNNGGDGYGGVRGLGRTANIYNEEETLNYIILSDHGETMLPSATLRGWGKTFENQLIIGEVNDRLFVIIGDNEYVLPKDDLLTTTDQIFSYPSVQQLFVDLIGEGIFTE